MAPASATGVFGVPGADGAITPSPSPVVGSVELDWFGLETLVVADGTKTGSANANRFGDKVPAPVTIFGVAADMIAAVTAEGVAAGKSERYLAARPATCGVAIDVPL